ncbi:NAD(P)-binding domain-containing protein [Myxococcota bacterium]|nr:NAD(P)-binding domain-containing protein [Myxococcota bacterium]
MKVLIHVHPGLLKRVREELPDVELIQIPQEGPIPDGVEGEVLLTQAWGSPNLRECMERGVRWVHTFGTGVNAFPFGDLGGVPLSCARGASAVPIAEWVLAVMLRFEKKLPESFIQEPPEQWNRAELGGLFGRTVGLVGLGGIGEAVAKRALAFDMEVLAYRRTAQPSAHDGVEVVETLDDLLTRSDHLVVAASATPATRHLLGREAFERVKPGVHLVNIARGELVDQDALREALDDGRVECASLDCVDPEPLPEGHWLYTHPRVLLSPHISWAMPGATLVLADTFAENLHRYIAGEPLEGLVDVEHGY